MVTGEDDHLVGLVAFQQVEVLIDGVGRALVPASATTHLWWYWGDELAQFRIEDGPAVTQVFLQRMRLVLGDHQRPADAAGADSPDDCDDAVTLWQAAGRPDELDRVCPQRFPAPLAPHLAAAAEGRRLDETLLRTGLDYWRQRSDYVVVEGAGGLLSPIGPGTTSADRCSRL